MSTPTKIFIVLLVVLSIALSMTTISFVAQTAPWKDLATKYRAQAHAAQTSLANIEAISKAQIAILNDQVRSLTEQISSLQQELTDARRELADAQKQLAAEQTSRETLESNNTRLSAMLQAAEQANAELRKRRDALLQENADLSKRNIDLSNRVRELTDTVTQLTEQVKAAAQREYQLQQQIADLREQLRQVRAAAPLPVTAAAPKGMVVTPGLLEPIRGKITEIKGDLASISVGSSSGVRKGMTFIIYRGSDYLGELQIQLVEPDRAAGVITTKIGEIREGDLVADKARFAAGD